MLAGGIDMMVEVPPTSLGQFQGDGFSVVEQAGPHVWFLILNAKEGPFADKRVRQALNYAINKQAILDALFQGAGKIAWNFEKFLIDRNGVIRMHELGYKAGQELEYMQKLQELLEE